MSLSVADAGLYLRRFLGPLDPFLARADVTDIYVNRPGELWVEALGGNIERHDVPELTETSLAYLARQIAALSHQGVSREHPLLSAALPDGSRAQIVMAPASPAGTVLAIRKHVAADLGLADYAAADAFVGTNMLDHGASATDELIAGKLDTRDYAGALATAVRARKTILISGGTGTGKTTFLNALIKEVPRDERLIVIEDTPEVRVEHPNAVRMIAVRGALGEAQVTADDLVTASLRMRPDRIILGELRGDEAFTFLRAVNTGHPGSITTVHADSLEGAIEQIVLLVLQRGTRLTRNDVRNYVRAVVHLQVQLKREGGRRTIEAVARCK